MNSPIEQTPLSWERLPHEKPRAYRAFCVYRDLGPDRSLNRAWVRFCADQGKDRGSARRPGYWAAWCLRYRWVERAEAHDDFIAEEERIVTAERRRKLRDERSRFEEEEQQCLQNRVRNIDSVLDKAGAAPFTEVTQVKRDKVTGTTTTTKIRPPNLRDIAALTETRNKTARQAIRGVHEIKDLEKERREIERVVWVRNKDRNPTIQDQPESGQGNPQPIADAHPADPEADCRDPLEDAA